MIAIQNLKALKSMPKQQQQQYKIQNSKTAALAPTTSPKYHKGERTASPSNNLPMTTKADIKYEESSNSFGTDESFEQDEEDEEEDEEEALEDNGSSNEDN